MIDDTAYIHDKALVEPNANIGKNTRVWAFSHILDGVKIGSDCNICDHTFIEGDVTIGDRVTIKSGVYLWDGLIVEDDVFIGPAAVFTNDKYPRSKNYPESYPKTILRNGASIGANSTILPAIEIGEWSIIGAGSVVTKSIPAYSVVYGNPANIMGWVCSCGSQLEFKANVQTKCLCGKNYKINKAQNTIIKIE